jgi:hypothetical protein
MTPIIIASGLYVKTNERNAGIDINRNAGGGTGSGSGKAGEGVGEKVGLIVNKGPCFNQRASETALRIVGELGAP